MKRDLMPEPVTPAVVPAVEHARAWRLALLPLALVLLWILGWFASTAKSMADIWSRSDTFAHGFVVPLIVAWLIWRQRAKLALLTPEPSWSGVALATAAGLMWLLGEVAAVNALAQFALTALLVVTVFAVLGRPVTHELAFPLAFLFFAVPVGDFIMPQLMEWTADFTVGALRLTGIPVYREGQQFVIPSGHWSVIEACSGLRYLVASLMVGTLFAYLSYRSNVRRLVFIGVSIVVPIVANWLRAYMIVMLGHLSGNKLAVGVDHFIYGWVFFGVVIAIMLAIGARWREDHELAPSSPVVAGGPAPKVRSSGIWLAAAAVALVAFAWKMGYEVIERSDASNPPMIATLASAGDWAPVPTAAPWRPRFQNPPDELLRVYRNDRNQVAGLFIGYYRNQDQRHKLVSSENVLVTTDDTMWLQVASGTEEVAINGSPVTIRTAELRGSGGRRMVVWRWYWINGRLTSSDYRAKAYTALARLSGRGDDSAVVLVYADEDQPGGARTALESFVRAQAPAIEEALRRTRDTR